MIRQLKLAAFAAVKAAGLFGLIHASGWRRRRLLILCYHGVSLDDEHLWNPFLFIAPAFFERRLRLLRALDCRVLPLEEAVRALYAGELPPRAVALTFDDGTVDFHHRAWPLLNQFGYPATVYLTTYYAARRQPVFPIACDYMLWKRRGHLLRRGEALDIGQDFDPADAAMRCRAVRWLAQRAERENYSADDKDALARQLASQIGLDYDEMAARRILQIMSPEEVASVARAGADVQLHTHRHRTPRDPLLFAREIVDNRNAIRAMTGTEARHFCYPSGVYREEFLPWLRQQQVLTATTCDHRLASPASHPLLLPRLVDHAMLTELEFEGWLCGAGACIPNRWGRAVR